MIRKKLNLLLFCFAITLTYLIASSVYSEEEKKENKLAKVAIAEFIDNTGTDDYQYLKGSISDAMDGFMQKRFEYDRIEPNVVNRAIQRSVKQYKEFEDFTSEDLKDIAESIKADVIVYGFYKFDSETREIVLYTKIYLAFIEVTVDIETVRSKVDSSLFQVVDIIAAKLVSKIEEMSTASGASEEKTSEGKIVLTRESLAKGMPKVWPPSLWEDMLIGSDQYRNSILIGFNLKKRVFALNLRHSKLNIIKELDKKPVQAIRYKTGFALCVSGLLSFYSTEAGFSKTKHRCEKTVHFYEPTGSIFYVGPSKAGNTEIGKFDFTGKLVEKFSIPYESSSQAYSNHYYFGSNFLAQYIYEKKKTRIFHYDGTLSGEFRLSMDYLLKFTAPDIVAAAPQNRIYFYTNEGKLKNDLKLPESSSILAFDVDHKRKLAIVVTSYTIHLFDLKKKNPVLIQEVKISFDVFSNLKNIGFTKVSGIYKLEYKNKGNAYFQFTKTDFRLYHYVFDNGIGIPADYEMNNHKLYIKRIVAVGGFIELAKLYIDDSGILVVAGKNKYDIIGKFDKWEYLLKSDRYLRERRDKLVRQPGLLAGVLHSVKPSR